MFIETTMSLITSNFSRPCWASHNAHDNEILSIIEELREAGLIIN